MNILVAILYFLISSAIEAAAAQYYVDYASGLDVNKGTSIAAAWQHCPGDSSATGVAGSIVILAGDVVNFKGGVTYRLTGGSASAISLSRSGTAGNPIVYQTGPGWGLGNAILDGGQVAYNVVNPSGDAQFYSGLTITNFLKYGFALNTQKGITISNCIINNGVFVGSGTYAAYGVNSRQYLLYGNGEAGINVGGMIDTIIVSNEISCTGQKGVSLYGGATRVNTNLVIWGNYFHDTQDDPINMGCSGYLVIAFNRFWHCTNSDNNIGAHSDASQILHIPFGSTLVYAFNSISNINGGGFFYEPNAANDNIVANDSSTLTNVFNLTAGIKYQVCTNQSKSPQVNSTTRFCYGGALYKPGDVFDASKGSSGYWSGTNTAFIVVSAPNGTAIFSGNTVESAQYNGVDAYDSLSAFWSFNNTYTNCAAAVLGSDARNFQVVITNQYFYNELLVGCGRQVPLYVAPDNSILPNNVTEHSGYNLYTVDGLFADTPTHNTTLSRFQSVFPGLEKNSLIGTVSFVGPGDFRVLFSSGTGRGTNLTAIIPDISFVPSRWRPDLTKDAAGTQRPALGPWDIGAFQGTNSPSSRVSPPVNFRLVKPS